MPPKNKKKAEEQKKKIIDDKTFGLKNKKKSKKVQNYVETVKKQASQKVDGPRKKGGSSSAASSAGSATHLAQMAARLAELEIMNKPVEAKSKTLSEEELERKRREEEEEAERIRIANLPVEDQIEEERVKLKSRTPVTLERFLKWKEEKDKERAARLEAERAAALKKLSRSERNRGQGLSGRELFQANAEIFVDDEGADESALKVRSDFIGDSDEDDEGANPEQKQADKGGDAADGNGDKDPKQTTIAEESLFGGDEAGEPPSTHTEAVGVGDESLFT